MNSEISNIIVGTLVQGTIFGIVGAGFVVLFRATKVLSFAQGAFMLIGALIFYSLTNAGLEMYLALVLSIIGAAILGLFLYQILFARMVGREQFIVAIATIGLGSVIQMIAIMIWGANVLNIVTPLSNAPTTLFGFILYNQVDIFVIVLGIVLGGGTIVWLRYSRMGVQMRATADSEQLAAYSGISVPKIAGSAWAIAAALGAAGGIMYSIGNGLDPVGLPTLGLAVFPGIILGGLDSVGGAFIGGLLVGLLQSIVALKIGGLWQDPVSYMVLLVVLVLRPRGLFGSQEIARI
jgi:branched-chain amino acid transport system permease protein